MSYPHFYNADQYYLDQVEGLEPNKEDHEFYMVVEPNTGIPLEVAARFQVNMLVEPVEGITLYTDVPRIYFPLIWFEQKVRITPELADQIKMLPMVLLAGQIFSGLCLAIGLVLLCWIPAQQLINSCHSRYYGVNIQQKSNGQYKTRSRCSSSEELKSKASTLVCEKSAGVSQDSSQLLDSNRKPVKLMTKSLTGDSVATASTVLSETAVSK